MTPSIDVREYRDGDEMGVLDLFEAVYGERRVSSEVWRWQYEECPIALKSISVVEHSEAGIIAHFAAVPLDGRIGGRARRFALALDAMTHPEHRAALFGRRGAFIRCASELIERSRTEYDFGFGFPAPRHLRLGQLALGYDAVRDIPYYELPLEGRSPRGDVSRRGRIRSFDSFGFRADRLWHKVKDEYPFAVARESVHLNWRYRDRPDRDYRMLALTTPLGRWKAFSVLHVEGERAMLVDLLVPRYLPAGCDRLIESNIEFAARLGAKTLSCWMPKHSPGFRLIDEAGFRRAEEPQKLKLAVLILDEGTTVEKVAREFHYQMGDSDMF